VLFVVAYILITGYSVLLFMNPLNFKFLQVPAVAVILKVLLKNAKNVFTSMVWAKKAGPQTHDHYSVKS